MCELGQKLLSWFITPFHKRRDFPQVLTIDDKIQIFYERVTGWQLEIANKVINGFKDDEGNSIKGIKDSGFGALSILFSYFEMIAKYRDGYCGTGKTKVFFKQGFDMVFPELTKDFPWLTKKMYYNVRCGLYHHGMTEADIILKGGEPPITVLGDRKVILNPHELVLKLKNHFEEYIAERGKDIKFQSNFEKRFDTDNG